MDTPVMTPAEFARRMQEIREIDEEDTSHRLADDLMADLLRSLGYAEGIDVYETNWLKWYC